MKRRTVLLTACAGALAHVHAQVAPGAKAARIVVVSYFTEEGATRMKTFLVGQLKAIGYVEGQNLGLELRSLLGADDARQRAIAAEIVRSRPDVIIADGTAAALLLTAQTTTIPIVMWASVDPVGAGVVKSLAHPGGNVTGLATDVVASAEEKRAGLLLDLVPKARRIAFVGTRLSWDEPWGEALRRGAAKRKVGVVFAEGGLANNFTSSIEIVKREKPDALFIALAPGTTMARSVFRQLTLDTRVPSACAIVEMAEDCVLVYGQSATGFITRSLTYVDRILKGAKPGDLPIEQPTKFQLVVNMKLAKEIGVTIPRQLLLSADQLIE